LARIKPVSAARVKLRRCAQKFGGLA